MANPNTGCSMGSWASKWMRTVTASPVFTRVVGPAVAVDDLDVLDDRLARPPARAEPVVVGASWRSVCTSAM